MRRDSEEMMFVTLLKLVAEKDCEQTVHQAEFPTISDIENAINKLNGKNLVSIFLKQSKEIGYPSMNIYGGFFNRYHLNVYIPSEEKRYFLIGPGKAEGRINIRENEEDDDGLVRKDLVVGKEEVLLAARCFAETGEMTDRLKFARLSGHIQIMGALPPDIF